MNSKPLIIDIQGKALETDKKRKQDEENCHKDIARALKKYRCKFVIEADPKVVVRAIVEDGK